jgi:hypothetical protein
MRIVGTITASGLLQQVALVVLDPLNKLNSRFTLMDASKKPSVELRETIVTK